MEKTETLEDFLSEYDYLDLQESAAFMGYKGTEEVEILDDDAMAHWLAKAILKNPVQVLSRLPAEDINLLDMLKDVEPGLGMKAYNTTQYPCMCSLGLARMEEADDEEMLIIFIPDDLKRAVRKHIDKVKGDFKVQFRLYIESLMIGALNISGVLTKSQLKAILRHCLELEDDGSGLFDNIMKQSIAMNLQRIEAEDDNDEDLFVSPFLHDYEAVIKARKNHPELKKPKLYSRDVLQMAGSMPLSTIPSANDKKLIKCYTKTLGMNLQKAYVYQFMTWRMAQEENTSPMDIVQHVLDVAGKDLKGGARLNQVVGVIIDYLNSAPRWDFYGYTPNDMHLDMGSMAESPRIQLGPNATAKGHKQEQAQQMADEEWSQQKRSKTPFELYDFDDLFADISMPVVGRNDPCPCGSGKKYKNCCGRGN